ncbi:hypothetical protein F4805DRAFT_408290 [Annulohypoxylon moriforme]|nr:hypothetical protein F4805DRAFT_408290 [Annulohypoxylon moriforme]
MSQPQMSQPQMTQPQMSQVVTDPTTERDVSPVTDREGTPVQTFAMGPIPSRPQSRLSNRRSATPSTILQNQENMATQPNWVQHSSQNVSHGQNMPPPSTHMGTPNLTQHSQSSGVGWRSSPQTGPSNAGLQTQFRHSTGNQNLTRAPSHASGRASVGGNSGQLTSASAHLGHRGGASSGQNRTAQAGGHTHRQQSVTSERSTASGNGMPTNPAPSNADAARSAHQQTAQGQLQQQGQVQQNQMQQARQQQVRPQHGHGQAQPNQGLQGQSQPGRLQLTPAQRAQLQRGELQQARPQTPIQQGHNGAAASMPAFTEQQLAQGAGINRAQGFNNGYRGPRAFQQQQNQNVQQGPQSAQNPWSNYSAQANANNSTFSGALSQFATPTHGGQPSGFGTPSTPMQPDTPQQVASLNTIWPGGSEEHRRIAGGQGQAAENAAAQGTKRKGDDMDPRPDDSKKPKREGDDDRGGDGTAT